MRISPVGRIDARAGVTLVELLVVGAIIGIIAAISFPSVNSGVDSLRLQSAVAATASFLNGALNRADRRQEPVEISIAPKQNLIALHSTEQGFERKLEMPDGIKLEGLVPAPPEGMEEPFRFVVMPGSTPPRIGVLLSNRHGSRRIVRVDPITGVPRTEVVESQ